MREYDDFGHVSNLFEDSVGEFWDLDDPRKITAEQDMLFLLPYTNVV